MTTRKLVKTKAGYRSDELSNGRAGISCQIGNKKIVSVTDGRYAMIFEDETEARRVAESILRMLESK